MQRQPATITCWVKRWDVIGLLRSRYAPSAAVRRGAHGSRLGHGSPPSLAARRPGPPGQQVQALDVGAQELCPHLQPSCPRGTSRRSWGPHQALSGAARALPSAEGPGGAVLPVAWPSHTDRTLQAMSSPSCSLRRQPLGQELCRGRRDSRVPCAAPWQGHGARTTDSRLTSPARTARLSPPAPGLPCPPPQRRPPAPCQGANGKAVLVSGGF